MVTADIQITDVQCPLVKVFINEFFHKLSRFAGKDTYQDNHHAHQTDIRLTIGFDICLL